MSRLSLKRELALMGLFLSEMTGCMDAAVAKDYTAWRRNGRHHFVCARYQQSAHLDTGSVLLVVPHRDGSKGVLGRGALRGAFSFWDKPFPIWAHARGIEKAGWPQTLVALPDANGQKGRFGAPFSF